MSSYVKSNFSLMYSLSCDIVFSIMSASLMSFVFMLYIVHTVLLQFGSLVSFFGTMFMPFACHISKPLNICFGMCLFTIGLARNPWNTVGNRISFIMLAIVVMFLCRNIIMYWFTSILLVKNTFMLSDMKYSRYGLRFAALLCWVLTLINVIQ